MALIGSALSGARFPGAPLNRANVGRGPMAGGGGPANQIPVDARVGFKNGGFKNPAAAIHSLAGFAPSQPSLAHLLAAAAAAHPGGPTPIPPGQVPMAHEYPGGPMEPAGFLQLTQRPRGMGRNLGPEQPANTNLPAQAGNYAQLLPMIQAIVGNPNFRY